MPKLRRSRTSRPPRLASALHGWFWGGLLGVFLLAIALRFWGLGRFNTLVFDEVYFVRFGYNYLAQIPFFDAHPPLGKYLIALSIWLGGFNPWGYRWLNALVGALLPLVVAGIAYQLTHRRSYALIAALFVAVDGLFIVESRYGLINIYLLVFGLGGQWAFLRALEFQGQRRWRWLLGAGLALGGTISVKWSGLGFLLGLFGVYVAWGGGWLIQKLYRPLPQASQPMRLQLLPLQNLGQLHPLQVFAVLPGVAALVYGLVWIPHLRLNPTPGFLGLQQQMLNYHEQVGSGPDVHPYCSAWYTWPWLVRPVDYFYQTARTAAEPVPMVGPPLPREAAQVIYDVHALGNPILWWLSTLAMISVVGVLVWQLWQRGTQSRHSFYTHPSRYRVSAESLWVPLYLVINYGANFLPWMDINRCTFLYHYMPAAIYTFLSLAWLVEQGLRSYRLWLRVISLTAIFLILAALVYWLPIYLGLPLTPAGFERRMLFRSWI
jgi:dolichyl-phosphate-mannose-protein mannosyltransferase